MPEPGTADRGDVRATLLRRARARYLSMPLAVTLAEVPGPVQDDRGRMRSPLAKSYRNTVYCTATLSQESGKITGTYCGNRWCMVCNRIRTARAIARYLPVVDGWGDDRWLVTLTLRNVPAPQLPATIAGMVKDFQAIKLGMRRTDRIRLIALRKLECTYNARTDEYHPHFHLVVKGEAAARLLLKRWLDRHPASTSRLGQDVRKADPGSLGELFKYFTKLLTKARGKSGERGTSAPVPPAALDVIFRSMKGRRVYQPVGFRAAGVDDEAEEINPQEATEAPSRPAETVFWEWRQSVSDWVDSATGECLTGYEPAVKFRELVDAMNPPQLQLIAPAIRTLEQLPTEGIDPDKSRKEMQRALLQRPRDGDVFTAQYVSETVQRLLQISAARAAELAQEITGCDIYGPSHQLALIPASDIRPPTYQEKQWRSGNRPERAPRKRRVRHALVRL